MKRRFNLFRRAGVFYSEDTTTGKQLSLRTKDEAEALTLLHSKNEAHRQPVLNLQIARTYLTATDPEVANRTAGLIPSPRRVPTFKMYWPLLARILMPVPAHFWKKIYVPPARKKSLCSARSPAQW